MEENKKFRITKGVLDYMNSSNEFFTYFPEIGEEMECIGTIMSEVDYQLMYKLKGANGYIIEIPSAIFKAPNKESYVIHNNVWNWGKSIEIISSNGKSAVQVFFDNKFPDFAFVRNLTVHETVRRKGNATRIFSYAETVARTAGKKHIQLKVEKTNKWLLNWYKSMGYSVIENNPLDCTLKKDLN